MTDRAIISKALHNGRLGRPIDIKDILQSMGSAAVGVGLVAAGICPMYGPVVKTSLAELVRQYR